MNIRKLRREISSALITTSIIALVLIFTQIAWVSWKSISLSIFYSFAYGLPLYFGNSYLFDYLNSKYPWHTNGKERFIYGLIYSIAITMLIIAIINATIMLVKGQDLSVLWSKKHFYAYYGVAFIITVIVSLFFHALGFYNEVRNARIREEKLRLENLSARYEALKSQVDPHFLFNGLSVLSSLIEEQPSKAQEFVDDLAGIYRYVLEQKKNDIVDLKEELDFAEKYISLHQKRFENCISYKVAISREDQDKKIMSLTLQLLMENIFKHNRITQSEKMNISITSSKQYLIIQNNKYPKNNVSSNKSGLQNIKDRYAFFSHHPIELEDTPEHFTVKIPFVHESDHN